MYSIYANLDNTGDISIIFLHNQPFEFSRNATTATDTHRRVFEPSPNPSGATAVKLFSVCRGEEGKLAGGTLPRERSPAATLI